MTPSAAAELLERRFRLHPSYRVVPVEALTPAELQWLGGVRGSDLTAVLLPVGADLAPKAISADSARVLEALRAPARLPPTLREELGADPGVLVRLVLDSVLEVEHDGGFVSGPSAAGELGVPSIEPARTTETARVSMAALHYGEALRLDDARVLAARLYAYNRIPVSPRWTATIGAPEQVATWLGLGAGSPLRSRLDRDWREASPLPENPTWRIFRSAAHTSGARFKLYLNPRPDLCRDALEAALPILAACRFAAFKVGRDLMGVLRPDKMVAYAHSRAQIDAAAEGLLRTLEGVPAQAVPFTGGVDDAGLVSWGMDPPPAERVSVWQGTSWRRWITDRLAIALIAGRAGGARSATDYARARLALDGVDVVRWMPADVAWAREAGR